MGLSLSWSIREEKVMDIKELRKAFISGIPVEYKMHCQKRMLERNISRRDISNCILYGEIIEDYPLDDNSHEESFPACLIMHVDIQRNGTIHVVVGFNGRKIIIISAYHPDKVHWEADLKTRKEN